MIGFGFCFALVAWIAIRIVLWAVEVVERRKHGK